MIHMIRRGGKTSSFACVRYVRAYVCTYLYVGNMSRDERGKTDGAEGRNDGVTMRAIPDYEAVICSGGITP